MRWRAAQYVRMSTEHQQYSTENQRDKIREYAAKRGIEIVQTYADEGKSGLRLDGRQALQQLIRDVESGQADFQMILVYDVSRWGRFQDASVRHFVQFPHVPIQCDISKFNFGHQETLTSQGNCRTGRPVHP